MKEKIKIFWKLFALAFIAGVAFQVGQEVVIEIIMYFIEGQINV